MRDFDRNVGARTEAYANSIIRLYTATAERIRSLLIETDELIALFVSSIRRLHAENRKAK